MFDDSQTVIHYINEKLSLDFYELAEVIKKRISFFGIYECRDQVDLNTRKLNLMKNQLKQVTRHLTFNNAEMRAQVAKVLEGGTPAGVVKDDKGGALINNFVE